MPYSPLRLLILFDNHRRLCGSVVPTLKAQLEHQGFLVDAHSLQAGRHDLSSYRGLIVGAPALGVLRPTVGGRMVRCLEAESLQDWPVAAFVVGRWRVGRALPQLRDHLVAQGARIVATQAYHRWNLNLSDTSLAAECMVRIR